MARTTQGTIGARHRLRKPKGRTRKNLSVEYLLESTPKTDLAKDLIKFVKDYSSVIHAANKELKEKFEALESDHRRLIHRTNTLEAAAATKTIPDSSSEPTTEERKEYERSAFICATEYKAAAMYRAMRETSLTKLIHSVIKAGPQYKVYRGNYFLPDVRRIAIVSFRKKHPGTSYQEGVIEVECDFMD